MNGYSHAYWGWGQEDDDLGARMRDANVTHARAFDYPGPRREEDGEKPGDGAVHGPRPKLPPRRPRPDGPRLRRVPLRHVRARHVPPDARRDHRGNICPAVEVARGRDVLRARARGRVLARRGGEVRRERRGRQDVGGVPVWSALGRRRQRKVPEGRGTGLAGLVPRRCAGSIRRPSGSVDASLFAKQTQTYITQTPTRSPGTVSSCWRWIRSASS